MDQQKYMQYWAIRKKTGVVLGSKTQGGDSARALVTQRGGISKNAWGAQVPIIRSTAAWFRWRQEACVFFFLFPFP
jgi:hypothetical protein